MDLAEFLLTRIAEDEAVARATRSRKWDAGADFVEADDSDGELPNDLVCEVDDWNRGIDGEPTRSRAEHIARWDPARVLAECEAKRQLVEMAGSDLLGVLCAIALPYASHKDYREEWRPQASNAAP